MNKQVPYCFSVKKNTGKPDTCTKEIYEEYIKDITSIYPIKVEDVVYEHDKQSKRLHFHAILICDKNFYRAKLRKQGWNIHYMELTSVEAWQQYCLKDQKPKQPKKKSKSLFISVPQVPKKTEMTMEEIINSDLLNYEKWSEEHDYKTTSESIHEQFHDYQDEKIIPI